MQYIGIQRRLPRPPMPEPNLEDHLHWFTAPDGQVLSVVVYPVIASFSNTTPYTGDEYAVIGDVTTSADIGLQVPKGRWVSLGIHSDEGGSVPSSDCSVETRVDDHIYGSVAWDGTNYGLTGLLNFNFPAGRLTFKYIDGGTSAGKVTVIGYFRRRR